MHTLTSTQHVDEVTDLPALDPLTAAAAQLDDDDVRTLLQALEVCGLAAGGHIGTAGLAERLNDGEVPERVWRLYARVARGAVKGLVVLGVDDPPPATAAC